MATQVCIIWFAANGPFVDEALYTVAGMRVLEGKGLSGGYLTYWRRLAITSAASLEPGSSPSSCPP